MTATYNSTGGVTSGDKLRSANELKILIWMKNHKQKQSNQTHMHC